MQARPSADSTKFYRVLCRLAAKLHKYLLLEFVRFLSGFAIFYCPMLFFACVTILFVIPLACSQLLTTSAGSCGREKAKVETEAEMRPRAGTHI